jgi:phosphoribosylformimino-5-aminoimidazole carboxamide ribotide isomerase
LIASAANGKLASIREAASVSNAAKSAIQSGRWRAVALAQALWHISVLGIKQRARALARPGWISAMRIWPAIDLRGGKCVRLRQGDYQRETVYGDDPAEMARRWSSEGAQCLHLVDLDGARDGSSGNLQAVQAILAAVTIPCQLGGGIRDDATIERLLGLGLARLVIGTRALKEPDWFRGVVRRFPGQVALGIDAKAGLVATDGWLKTSTTSAIELAQQFAGEPLAAIVYTDIARDGMLQGPNVEATAEMNAAVNCDVIASGGVTTTDDVHRLTGLGLAGCIIGRALYDGTLKLADALAAAREVRTPT